MMLKNMHREYNFNRIHLSCFGLWPFQRKRLRDTLSILCFFITISFLPFEVATLYIRRHSAALIFECLYHTAVIIAFVTKLMNQLWNREHFRRLYNMMENHWNICTNEVEIRILKTYSRIAHKFTISYTIMVYILMILFITIPPILGPAILDLVFPLNESRPGQLIVDAEYGIDPDKYFLPINLYMSFMVTVGISIMIAVDSMHIACTVHACALFRLVGQQIEDILSYVRANKETEGSGCCVRMRDDAFNEEVAYREYMFCVKKHQFALDYVDTLDITHKIVGMSFLILLAALLLLIAMKIVYMLGHMEEVFRLIVVIMGSMLQLILVCYSGQKLMDESQNIFHQAYAAEWYHFSPRMKTLLSIILYRSIVPCRLTAGGILTLSIAVFAGVIRTATSYFTAFLSLKE